MSNNVRQINVRTNENTYDSRYPPLSKPVSHKISCAPIVSASVEKMETFVYFSFSSLKKLQKTYTPFQK